jgi:hypothetical protein
MKIKEKDSNSTEKLPKGVNKNGTIEKKKKKKDNFEVHVPRIIVRNLNFKVNKIFQVAKIQNFHHIFTIRSMKIN